MAESARDRLFSRHEELCNQARDLMRAKNLDYAGGTDDCFASFRGAAFLGVEPEIGLLLRCMDKFMRIRTFVGTGALAVTSESATDCLVDVINYMVLLDGLMRERAKAVVHQVWKVSVEVPESVAQKGEE